MINLVNCTWNEWETWETCSVTCGGGYQGRNKTKNPAQNGGAACAGNDTDPNAMIQTENQTCNADPCPGIYFYFLLHHLG